MAIVIHFRESIMAAQARVLKNGILLGQVIPSTLTQAIKVQVPYFVFDDVLKAYFKKAQDFIAHDVENLCKTGDLVIIKQLEKPEKKEITHTVTERIFRLGDVQDPISGEMVVGTQYRFVTTPLTSTDGSNTFFCCRSDLLEEAKLYGADVNNFDYEGAPDRGRLEGTRDFTDKPTYRKWHKFEKDDPYGVRN